MSYIRNDNEIGQYQVIVIANSNQIASFQTDSLFGATIEAQRIATERAEQGLPTARATAQEIIGHMTKGKKRIACLGETTEITLETKCT